MEDVVVVGGIGEIELEGGIGEIELEGGIGKSELEGVFDRVSADLELPREVEPSRRVISGGQIWVRLGGWAGNAVGAASAGRRALLSTKYRGAGRGYCCSTVVLLGTFREKFGAGLGDRDGTLA